MAKVVIEKLIVAQLVQILFMLYETWRTITVAQ